MNTQQISFARCRRPRKGHWGCYRSISELCQIHELFVIVKFGIGNAMLTVGIYQEVVLDFVDIAEFSYEKGPLLGLSLLT